MCFLMVLLFQEVPNAIEGWEVRESVANRARRYKQVHLFIQVTFIKHDFFLVCQTPFKALEICQGTEQQSLCSSEFTF